MIDDLGTFIVGIIFIIIGLITAFTYKDFMSKWIGKTRHEFLASFKQSHHREILEKLTTIEQPFLASVATFCGSQNVILTEPKITHSLRASSVQFDNFFTPCEHSQLLTYIVEQESSFESATTTTGELSDRSSLVLYSFPEFSNLIKSRIQILFPDILSKLDLPFFDIASIESQLTAYNEGSYYRIHSDNSSSKMKTRVLTYVYYFNQTPKAFTGGELRLYDSQIVNNNRVPAKSFQTVEPRNNSIVFFLSHHFHEVLPVNCPSKNLADSRFTINGWIRC